jgi:DNA-binding NarL/FixJ family response regulator
MASMQSERLSTVFIVDDSAPIRTRLAEMLSTGSFQVVGEAANATDAIAGIRSTHPDSVLLDLNLGTQQGLDVLRAIHPGSPEIAFVVLTNHSGSQYRKACTEAGAAHFLDKSTEIDRVTDVLTRIASGNA